MELAEEGVSAGTIIVRYVRGRRWRAVTRGDELYCRF
jgi:hypothetical protein